MRAAEFHFIRVQYTDLPPYHRGYGYASRDGVGSGWWIVDWPAADNHFTSGIERLTRIDTGDPRHLRLTDDRLFDYPWIYATQTGWWGLSDAESEQERDDRRDGAVAYQRSRCGARPGRHPETCSGRCRSRDRTRRATVRCLALAEAHGKEAGQSPILDPDFAAGVEEIVRNRKPRNPPTWE